MGMTHAEAWGQTPARIVGVHSFSEDNNAKIAEKYGAKIFDSLEALLAAVDVVDICTPTHLHYEMVLLAAAYNKHIVCEKPLARTLRQAQEMIQACETAGVKLLVAHVVRFFPEYALAKSIVDRGEIGQVAVVRLTRASFKPGTSDSWFHNHEWSGGMMLDLMIHDFDYARWVAGDVESVFAKRVINHDPDAVGDYALAILQHKNGALSNIEGGWVYPKPIFRTALEIAGSEGLIEHPAESSIPLAIHLKEAAQSGNPDIAVPRSPVSESPYLTEIRHFYDVLVNESIKPRVTARDGLAALNIALAAIESARTGRRVRLEEIK